MNKEQQNRTDPGPLFETWLETASGFWNQMAGMWAGASGASEKAKPSGWARMGGARESMDSTVRMWKTVSSLMNEPGAMDAFFQGMNAVPQILMKMGQTAWERYFQLQQQFLERAGRVEEKTEAYQFDSLDQDVFKAWTDIYEEEVRKFLHVPQLGLTRAYQERASRSIDKLNLFQGALAQFIHILSLPMERSFRVMQDEVETLTREKRLPENSQDYYRMWIKILEGHYMTLFKSPEYTQVLARTLDAMEDFMTARREMLQDLVQMLPVPTEKDMDDLYKELYLLKKRVRRLEKG